MPKDMVDGKIQHSKLAKVPEKHIDRLSRFQIFQGDILVARKGDVRKCVLITKSENGWLTGSDCLKIVLEKEYVYPQFIYYQLKSPFIGKWLETISIGATMPSINTTLLSNIELSIPPLATQQKIAGILSAYDDLIENNRRQIRLLEEAAQKLYKEWFVKLRFPGYENTKVVDGVPEGWKKENIDKIYNIKYGKNLPTTEIQSSGKYPVYGANGVIGYYNISNCNQKVVLITSRGNGSGDVLCTKHKESFVTNNSFIVLPNQAYDYLQFSFIFGQMKSLDFRTIRTGSAQPQLTNNSISMLNIVYPSKEIIIEYCNIAEKYYEKIDSLDSQIQLLQSARDKLLPRLMNGEIEV